MITIEAVCVRVRDVAREEIERWVAIGWVRPDRQAGSWRFQEIDVARILLIRELRHDLHLGDEALPLVLSLMDQLYEERRRLRRLAARIERHPAARELLAEPAEAGEDGASG